MIDRQVFDILYLAMVSCMRTVRLYQLHQNHLSRLSEVKAHDHSLLSEADKASGMGGFQVLRDLPLEYDIKPEDSKGRKTAGAKFVVWLDNIDGTRPFVNGLNTSTVILSIYDYMRQKVVFVMIGSPISGDIWCNHPDRVAVHRMTYDYDQNTTTNVQDVGVNKHALDGQATVFFDYVNILGYFRKTDEGTRRIFTGEESLAVFNNVFRIGINPLMTGSNGQHQVLVASGGEKCVAGLTLAMGGPWDAAGILLVILAGGYARAFKKLSNGLFQEADPLNPLAYDVAVYGNNKAAVDTLCEACNFV